MFGQHLFTAPPLPPALRRPLTQCFPQLHNATLRTKRLVQVPPQPSAAASASASAASNQSKSKAQEKSDTTKVKDEEKKKPLLSPLTGTALRSLTPDPTATAASAAAAAASAAAQVTRSAAPAPLALSTVLDVIWSYHCAQSLAALCAVSRHARALSMQPNVWKGMACQCVID
jgi:hypothetical protein